MGVEDWSTDESQNLDLDGSDISRRASPGAPANELMRKLMAHVKELEGKIVSDGVEVDGVSIVNNSGTLTVVDVAISGDTEDLLTEKIAEIEAAATQAGEDATAAQTAATQAASSASDAASSVTSAATVANLAAEQADIAARAAARAQSGAAMAESAVQAVISGTNLNWQKTVAAQSVAFYPVPGTAIDPVFDFIFVETAPEEGVKSPDNPSTIESVSTASFTLCESEGVDETEYTVDLGGSYYGGTVDVFSNALTVTWEKVSIQNFVSNNVMLDYDPYIGFSHVTNTRDGAHYSASYPNFLACEKLKIFDASETVDADGIRATGSGTGASQAVRVFIDKDRLDLSGAADPTAPTTAEWVAAANFWLENNPIAYYYKRYYPASPVQTTLSLQVFALPQSDKYTARLNTAYNKSGNVQVGYAKSPIRSEYELSQAIIAIEGGE